MEIRYGYNAGEFDKSKIEMPGGHLYNRAVGNRCAVGIDDLELPISRKKVLALLLEKQFKVLEVDLISLARSCVGVSEYRRGARPSEAPAVVDCSSFIKWLYGQKGIWLPRRSIQQSVLGDKMIDPFTEIKCFPSEDPFRWLHAGDVVFVSGKIDYYHRNSKKGIGHVGIFTGEGSVIHAASKKLGVVETPFFEFANRSSLRVIKSYLPEEGEVVTLETPLGREIEGSDDIRWIVLQSLK